MASHPCDLVTLEPNRVVETLKNLTTKFCDYRVLDVVNLLPTANDGTITHLYMQGTVLDTAKSLIFPLPLVAATHQQFLAGSRHPDANGLDGLKVQIILCFNKV
ncbi:unnamed protein product [Lactuca saligna]|uniref:Uncharacterized protein n=1 Tax=Lactuca saligna TaxID=75948 RepID=A0AA35Z2K6_LACSI|nr:unnamed protein product [Lactuca saligna]